LLNKLSPRNVFQWHSVRGWRRDRMPLSSYQTPRFLHHSPHRRTAPRKIWPGSDRGHPVVLARSRVVYKLRPVDPKNEWIHNN